MTTPSYKVDCAHASSQSYSALCHPMDYCPPGSFVMAFSRQEYWSGLLFLPPRDLPNLRIKPASLVSPALAGRFFTTAQPGKNPPPPKNWIISVTLIGRRETVRLSQLELARPFPVA